MKALADKVRELADQIESGEIGDYLFVFEGKGKQCIESTFRGSNQALIGMAELAKAGLIIHAQSGRNGATLQ